MYAQILILKGAAVSTNAVSQINKTTFVNEGEQAHLWTSGHTPSMNFRSLQMT